MPTAPPFTRDPLRLSAYTLFSGSTTTSRIFLPLALDAGSADDGTWASLARAAGTPLTATTELYALLDRAQADGRHPHGAVSPATTQALLDALGTSLPLDEEIVAARWPGHAGDGGHDEELPLPAQTVGGWPPGDLSLTWTTLARCASGAERDGQLPVYLWTADLRLVLSCPLYSDSLFLASDQITAAHLRAAGLEAEGLLEDGPLMVTGG